MRFYIALLTFLFTASSFALTNKEVYDLVIAGKVRQIEFLKVKLSKNEKAHALNKMSKVVDRVSKVWPDTVLEGPYHLLGRPKLDSESLVGLFYENRIIGFLGYARAEAAMIEDCDFEIPASYKECVEKNRGAIYERFLANNKAEHIEEFFEPADFERY